MFIRTLPFLAVHLQTAPSCRVAEAYLSPAALVPRERQGLGSILRWARRHLAVDAFLLLLSTRESRFRVLPGRGFLAPLVLPGRASLLELGIQGPYFRSLCGRVCLSLLVPVATIVRGRLVDAGSDHDEADIAYLVLGPRRLCLGAAVILGRKEIMAFCPSRPLAAFSFRRGALRGVPIDGGLRWEMR